jgi:hypothetical protein
MNREECDLQSGRSSGNRDEELNPVDLLCCIWDLTHNLLPCLAPVPKNYGLPHAREYRYS